jgi:hypothetical protein
VPGFWEWNGGLPDVLFLYVELFDFQKPGFINPQGIAGAQDDRSLDDILQLTNIAWPMIGLA